MYNRRMLSRLLGELSAETAGGRCGRDDDEMREVAEKLDGLDCGLDSAELRKAVQQFQSLPDEKRQEILSEIVDRKLYIEQICQRYGVTRATLNRWQRKGKLPMFRHDSGGKDYLMASECDEAVQRYEREHQT